MGYARSFSDVINWWSMYALSTPNGVGNWFHRTWMDAEDGLNDFNFTRLHWTVHPDREKRMETRTR